MADVPTLIREVVPGFRVVPKDASLLMKILGVILFFTPDFMKRYTTTIGNTVYMPAWLLAQDNWHTSAILCHEARHVQQKRRYGAVLYSFLYLFPQSLALFALLAILAVWFTNLWLLCLLFLLCLAPLPAPWRMHFEIGGYSMNVLMTGWAVDVPMAQDTIQRAAREFSSSAYYHMWPWRKRVTEKLENQFMLRFTRIENQDALDKLAKKLSERRPA